MKLAPFVFSLGPLLVVLLYGIFNARFVVKKESLKDLVPSAEDSLLSGKRVYYWGVCLIAPFYRLFTALRLTPNHITTLGFLLTAAAAGVMIFWAHTMGLMTLLWAGWLLSIGGIFDMIDGLMAKLNRQHSVAGSYYDSVMDRFSEAILFIGLAWLYRESIGLIVVLLAFTGAMVTSYSRSAGEKFGVIFKGGLMQRTERIVFLGAGAVLTPAIAAILNHIDPQKFSESLGLGLQIYFYPLLLVAILSNYTAIYRTWHVFKKLKEITK